MPKDTAQRQHNEIKRDMDNLHLHEGPNTNVAHLVSSTERFAQSHGMTPQQVQDAIQARKQVSIQLHQRILALSNETFTDDSEQDEKQIGKLKHQLICQSRYTHLRNPFVCKKCWTHLPICVCSLFESKSPLPKGVRGVYVWTHHEEWGRTSNTGSLLPLGLEKTQMLMKGLSEHDEIFQTEVLDNNESAEKHVIPVVLWPGKGGDNKTVSLSELKDMIRTDHDRIGKMTTKEVVIVSIEGTWNNGRKMASKLPSHILRLDVGEEITDFFSDNNHEDYFTQSNNQGSPLPKPTSSSPSLLAPLRRQGKGKDGIGTNVSTLEATVIALLGLGMDKDTGKLLFSNAKEKVDRIRRFTGKVYART
jgi:DTW domain-containing protein YfiP